MFNINQKYYQAFIVVWALCGAGMFCSRDARASSVAKNVSNANTAFKERDYAQSIKGYSDALKQAPDSDIVNFNLGTAYYKSGEYGSSIKNLEQSLLTEDEILKKKSLYNLGNAYYKSGISHEKDNLDLAINNLEKSLDYYDNSIKLGTDEDASFNKNFVEKELERLKQKKKQEEQKQDNKHQQEKPSKDKQDKDPQSRDDQSNSGQSKERKSEEGQNQADKNKDKQGTENQHNKENQAGSQESQDKNGGSNPPSRRKDSDEKSAGESKPLNNQDERQGGQKQYQENDSLEDSSEEKDKPQNNGQQEGAKEQSSKQAGDDKGYSYQPGSENELSEYEAKILLDNYEQSEQPKGLLSPRKFQGKAGRVINDW